MLSVLLHLLTTFPTCLQEIPKSINWVATIKYKITGSNTGGQEKGRQKHGDFDFGHITEVCVVLREGDNYQVRSLTRYQAISSDPCGFWRRYNSSGVCICVVARC